MYISMEQLQETTVNDKYYFGFQIQIYYDVNFTDITVKNLLQVIEDEPESEVYKLFHKLSTADENIDKRKFLRWVLYGDHKLREETD